MAAGAGTRMNSDLPKVLHRVAGRPMLEAVLDEAEKLDPRGIVVVAGHGRERVAAVVAGRPRVRIAIQDPPRGTGDAVARALPLLEESRGPVLVLSGDTPLITADSLRLLLDHFRKTRAAAALFSARPDEPGSLGRIVRRGGRFAAIVEVRDATAAQKKIREINAGIYCFDRAALARGLRDIRDDNAAGEYYLTDAVTALVRAKAAVEAIEIPDPREAMGVNSRRELAFADAVERRRGAERLIDQGATLLDPESTLVGPYVSAARDVVIHPFVVLEGRTRLAEGCEIKSFCDVNDSVVGPRTTVGPFARLRPGTVLEEDVRVGNFVETKKAHLKKGAKASHLSYLGDTEVGEDANIGAGTITCNYDGEKKHFTRIGRGAFIGSDTQLVAPVEIGDGAYVGAGSTITKSVPPGALAISREAQRNIEGWAAARRKKNGK
ncbi:MAG TPA: bifunctional UDP-N-acetylglucosamine diphosphorylase/glucosamine-1-phosphate N-acetyltransferase GlmU [Thermoanaerobaculia bacterium]|nr:bifunctional UDP-N-acetylglucosamine diphosphorylase/glucosamine-1-phosphate N-acetyltransferase GlmU [Thermoanaerobaculia bacterium]